MTVEVWSIVLNATLGVLIVGYGIWLKKIVDQQLKSKDSTIENFAAVIKAKEAEISKLERDAAPAIVDAYHTVKTFADDMAATVNKLNRQIEETQKLPPTLSPVQHWRAQGEGFLAATNMFSGVLNPLTTAGGHRDGYVSAHELTDAVTKFSSLIAVWTAAYLEAGKRLGAKL